MDGFDSPETNIAQTRRAQQAHAAFPKRSRRPGGGFDMDNALASGRKTAPKPTPWGKKLKSPRNRTKSKRSAKSKTPKLPYQPDPDHPAPARSVLSQADAEALRADCKESSLPLVPVFDADDLRVVLFRGRKVRMHVHRPFGQQEVKMRAKEPKNSKQIVVAKRQGIIRLSKNPRHVALKFLASPSHYNDPDIARAIGRIQTRGSAPLFATTEKLLLDIRGFKRTVENRVFALTSLRMVDLKELKPPILVLSDLMNARNVGAIARTALNLGVKSFLLSRVSWGTLNTTALRTSTYAILECDLAVTDDLVSAINTLKTEGVTVYAGENEAAGAVVPIKPAQSRNWALVVGNEAKGIPQPVIDAVTQLVTIPMQDGDSFGVAHASVICLYELARGMPPAPDAAGTKP